MSQTTLLEEVVQWNQEMCRQELTSVLPKLTSLHQKSERWEDHIRILKVITDMFLPHIGLQELEEACFSKVLPKAVEMFHTLLKEISNQVGELSSQNTALRATLRNILQAMMQIIEAMSACVRHVGSFERIPDLDTVRTLPSCVLKVLRDTFQHCKESEVMYCGRLSLVADMLQGLFKEAYSLHKSLMELLDKISLDNSASDEEVSEVVRAIHSLLDICSVISDLDIALHANTWKFIIKQSVRYQSLVEEHLHHSDISNSLCDNLLTSFHSCLELAEQIKEAGVQDTAQSPEYKLFQKTTKMCRFFANTLVHYIKEFKSFLTKYCFRFHQIYLQITSKFPPSLGALAIPSPLSEELNVVALVPMEALLSQLLPLRPFAEVVLQLDQRFGPEFELPQCLLLASVLSQLASQTEEVMHLWHKGSEFSEDTPRLPLFQALLKSFQRCCIERRVPVMLPGVMMKGQAQGTVTLHHHVCVQLCASIAALPPAFVPTLELCLVEAVLQADTQTALLASDMWCFMARYGTAELCLHHTVLIAKLLKVCAEGCHQEVHLGLMLRRLMFLMTPSHQMELAERFPPSQMENLTVWRHVLLRALSHDVRLRVETDIIALTQQVLKDWQGGGHKLGQMDKVNGVLSLLLVVARGGSSPEEQCMLSMQRVVAQLWSRMCPFQVEAHRVLQCTLRLLLSISAMLVKSIEPQVICQALVCVSALVSQKCPDEVVLAALEFMASLGKIFISHENQNQALPRLSSMFGALLAETSWLLHQHALEAFAQFAEITNHEVVLSQSLSVEDTKNKVVNYLSKTINGQEMVAVRRERLRLEAPVIEQHNEWLESNKTVESSSAVLAVTDAEEPCPKRARQETNTEEDYKHCIQTAESALKALGALTEGHANTASPPPQWLDSRLCELQMLITQIRTVNPSVPD